VTAGVRTRGYASEDLADMTRHSSTRERLGIPPTVNTMYTAYKSIKLKQKQIETYCTGIILKATNWQECI